MDSRDAVMPREFDLARAQEIAAQPHERNLRWWRGPENPFANARPFVNREDFFGGLPDDRPADEIIADLREGRKPRTWDDED